VTAEEEGVGEDEDEEVEVEVEVDLGAEEAGAEVDRCIISSKVRKIIRYLSRIEKKIYTRLD
jgi:hypothetical protein